MAEYLFENMWVTWLIIGAVFLLIELCTTSLVSTWFVLGSLITSGIACVWDNIPAQIVIFFVTSCLMLFLFKKLYGKKIKVNIINVEPGSELIGKIAVVEASVSDKAGRVKVGDVYWKAETDGEVIEKGQEVKVKNVNGTKLIVGK